ncbi:DUF4271 domain-containing protein [Aquimarina pacifica]|uniref:DUF4271 domain-containing protein n=1 Tax=Aquimarina pacifica TaxID=1296415 RepID=UPI00046FA6A1|nr:DUF4271 domain-containing protein [Aquimarina pacifica]
MDFILREIPSTNWQTILIVACMSLLAIARGVNVLLFSDFIMLFNTNKYIISHQKINKLSSLFNSLLVLFQVLSISLFLYLCFDVFGWQVAPNESTLFIKIAIIYTVVVVCKILIEKIIGAIFSIDDLIDEYLFYKISYRNLLGVILLPIVVVFTYTLPPSKPVFLVLFVLLGIGNSVLLVSFYKKNEKIIFNYMFYFILYLCTLEIAPYFILYKLIN